MLWVQVDLAAVLDTGRFDIEKAAQVGHGRLSCRMLGWAGSSPADLLLFLTVQSTGGPQLIIPAVNDWRPALWPGRRSSLKASSAPCCPPDGPAQAAGWLQSLKEPHAPETEEYGISSFVYRQDPGD